MDRKEEAAKVKSFTIHNIINIAGNLYQIMERSAYDEMINSIAREAWKVHNEHYESATDFTDIWDPVRSKIRECFFRDYNHLVR
jgi:hypothetical protein